jgi:hypothetical protein
MIIASQTRGSHDLLLIAIDVAHIGGLHRGFHQPNETPISGRATAA